MPVELKRRLRRVEDTLRSLFPSSSPKISPTPSKIHLKYADWDGLEICTSLLIENADVFRPLASAMSKLSRCIAIFENQARTCEEYNKLGTDINDLLRVLSRCLGGGKSSRIFQDRAVKLARAIDEETEPLRRREETGVERGVKIIIDPGQIMKCYSRVRALLARFVITESKEIWKATDEAVLDARLNQLPHSPEAQYHSVESNCVHRHGCASNTRVGVLQQLQTWARYSDNQKIYWLNGMAGTGKTTIAYSLCSQLESVGGLGASFFCSRQLPTCRNVGRILPSISHQLSRLSRPFRCMVSRVVEQNPNVQDMPFPEQLEKLVAAPLREVKYTFPSGMVIVIDALDECEDADRVDQILDALLTRTSDLPVKFLITSRPIPNIVNRIGSEQGELFERELRLHEINRSTVQNDIKKYLITKLEHPNRPTTNIESLVRQSGPLFLYADILAGCIRDGSPSGATQRLKQVLTTCTSAEVDMWYTTILQGTLGNSAPEDPRRCQMMLVLHIVVCAHQPLTMDDIADFPGVDPAGLVQHTLRPLWSLLQVSDTNGLVTVLHESFSNYILDQRRSGGFYCDPQDHNARLTLSCFNLIKEPNPPFNICDLESSYLRDREVPEIDRRMNKAISRGLLHACRKWETYLELAAHSEEVLCTLRDFLSTRLLLWMEILNLKRCMREGVEQLRRLHIWLKEIEGSDDVQLLVQDARSFVTAFLWSPLADSTPHIYVSMLPFWQEDRQISMHYRPRMPGLAKVKDNGIKLRTPIAQTSYAGTDRMVCAVCSPNNSQVAIGLGKTIRVLDSYTGQPIGQPLEGHTSLVTSVAYSHDGAYIASGSGDNTIRIWDASTGEPIGRPLEGHTSSVMSVAYSPDSANIVSGSEDRTIRIWNARTRQPIGQPLEGHTDSVKSVVYSRDGVYIVSGSWDKTIRMWDARTGEPVRQPLECRIGKLVGQPLEGHTEWVWSVAYSPNGLHIVSGSWDKNIRKWDARTGQHVGKPLEGHGDYVLSVAYSPNGAYIVSGSRDKTVRIWDAETGQPIGQPLEGHTNSVTSVAYSPDGAYVVSGSWDKTIRIWNAHTGQLVGRPLEGHTEAVRSVAYSPDGGYVASGSLDKTIRIWDARTGRPIGQPFKGHTDSVYSVAYSPNGAHIVSGSNDRTARIWDAYTGQLAGQPLEGHTGLVGSVAYSPGGAYIVSGSDDKTVRIWDAHTGQPVGQPLKGHTDSVKSVIYSPDSAYVVSGSTDKTICIWDAPTRPEVQVFEGHTDLVWSVACSPDSAYIVSSSWDKTIRIWDAQTGQPVGQPLEGHTGLVCSVTYSPDGAYILSGSWDKTMRMWDARTGQLTGQPFEAHTDLVCSAAYPPDGAYIVSGSEDRTICIWDARTGQPISQPLESHADPVGLAANPLDNVYALAGFDERSTQIWDIHTEHRMGQPSDGHTYSVRSVAYSPDGAYLVSGSWDRTIRIWDARTGQPIGRPLEGCSGPVMSVAYSPDGAYILSGFDDNTIHIWDAHTGQPVGQPLEGHTDSVRSVVYSPDGEYIASGSWDKTVRIWGGHHGQPVGRALEGHTGSVMSVSYSPDSARIASGSEDTTIRIWDAQTGQPIGQPLEGHTDWVCSVAYSPNGAYIVSGSDDKTIRIWDAHTGQPAGQPFKGHTDWVCSVMYSPDGAYVVSGSADNTLRTWDALTGLPVGQPFEGHTNSVMSVAYSPNGAYVASGSDDKTIRIWDAHTGQPAGPSRGGQRDPINSAVHSPGGVPVASRSARPTTRTRGVDSTQPVGLPAAGSAGLVCPPVYPSGHTPILPGGTCTSEATPNLSTSDPPVFQDTMLPNDWTLNEGGWAVNTLLERLIWVPPHARGMLLRPRNRAVISYDGSVSLDFCSAMLGEEWRNLFDSSRVS